jgi:RimJ/RimL family protein N-acetyltransferase
MAEFRLETEWLVLRARRDSDLDAFHALCTDPEVMRYLGPLQSRDEVAAANLRNQALQAEWGYCFWTLERKADGLFLGFCGLKPGPEGTPIEGQVEIGWRMRADCWGRGYAREAAQASLAWAWANLDVPVIAAITNIENTRSWGLMERLGMRRYPDEDFDHPALSEGDPLRPHILYRIRRPQ